MGAWILPAVQAAVGLGQSIFGGAKAKKAQRQLENLQSPTYRQNQSIMDYYNQALARYNVNPTESALYKRNMQNIQRNTAAGMMGLQDRRSALAGLPSLLRASNDASLNAEIAAEQQKDQRFNQLGGATEMRAVEDRMAFQQNELAPFERKYNLLAMKAGANNQTTNTGMQNIFGGLQSWQMADYLRKNPNSGGFYGTGMGRRYTSGWPK